MRAGIDFVLPARVAANLRGDAYLRDALNATPQAVRDRVGTLIGQLNSPTTRAAAQVGLRNLGPPAVPSLIHALSSASWQTRNNAQQQLRLMGDAALPALMTYLDGRPASLEGKRRAEQLLDEMGRASISGVINDAQGRLRREVDRFGNITFSFDYDDQGTLTAARWNNEQFNCHPPEIQEALIRQQHR